MADDVTRRTFLGTTAVVVLTSAVAELDAVAAPLPIADRRALGAAMDRIIPAEGRMPAGSALGGLAAAERVIASDRGVEAAVADALKALGPTFAAAAAAEQIAALTALERNHPQAFGVLRDLTYEAYYTNPKVWALLGYRFRTGARPTAPAEPFDERRIGRVRSMPRLYREAE